jgi:O6-methylguanine-DNA--protein-cysteine methyltransferase
MAPATYRRGGAGATVSFSTARCSLGWLLVAATDTGVCAVKLGGDPAALEADLRRELPLARVDVDRHAHREWVDAIARTLRGAATDVDLPLDVRGTAFNGVWRARIPAATRSYPTLPTPLDGTAVVAVASLRDQPRVPCRALSPGGRPGRTRGWLPVGSGSEGKTPRARDSSRARGRRKAEGRRQKGIADAILASAFCLLPFAFRPLGR